MEIRLCPCNKGNGRRNLRNKRTEDTKEIKAQLFQNYIPEIVPFTMESKRNNSTKYVMPNKTSDNAMYQNRKISDNVGKYYYKIL